MAIHPGPCLRCSLPWRSYGPHGLHECDNEHVYQHGADGSMTEVVYPAFTDDQIRGVEVALYRERRVRQIPDRRAALEELRREHEANSTWPHPLIDPDDSPTKGVLRKLAGDQAQALGGGDCVGWFPSTWWPDDAVQLVLADPAQTTELEELRAKVEQLLPLIEEREEWRRGMHADVAEISRLSLLLRGMARKLVAARAELNQEKRDSLWVMNRIRQSLGTPNDRAVSVHAAEVRAERDEAAADVDKFRDYLRMANNLVERRGAERDERQTRIDRALAEIAQWWGTGRPGDLTLMAVNSILRGHALLCAQPAPPDKTWCPRCSTDATEDRYTQESSTLWRCLDCHAVLQVPDPPIGSYADVADRATEVADALASDPEVFREDVEGTPGGGLSGAALRDAALQDDQPAEDSRHG